MTPKELQNATASVELLADISNSRPERVLSALEGNVLSTADCQAIEQELANSFLDVDQPPKDTQPTPMNLYHVSQTENTSDDTYSDFVVAAPDEQTARHTDPGSAPGEYAQMTEERWTSPFRVWASTPGNVVVELIGQASPDIATAQLICASFHAG